jgi:hypothetical protein
MWLQAPLLRAYLVVTTASWQHRNLGLHAPPKCMTCYLHPEMPGKPAPRHKQDPGLPLLHMLQKVQASRLGPYASSSCWTAVLEACTSKQTPGLPVPKGFVLPWWQQFLCLLEASTWQTGPRTPAGNRLGFPPDCSSCCGSWKPMPQHKTPRLPLHCGHQMTEACHLCWPTATLNLLLSARNPFHTCKWNPDSILCCSVGTRRLPSPLA